jgi:hypothetical protein
MSVLCAPHHQDMASTDSQRVVARFAREHCLFCGAQPVTKEHLIAAWVFRAIQRTRRPRLNHLRQSIDSGESTWSYGQHEEAAGVACRGCNTGWMSQSDQAASRLLKPVLQRRYDVVLDAEGRRAVALWTVKTVMVNDQPITAGNSQLAPHAQELRRMGQPQDFLEVWVGYPQRPEPGGQFQLIGVTPRNGRLVLGSGRDRQDHTLYAWSLMLGDVDLMVRPTLRWIPLPDPEGYERLWPSSPGTLTIRQRPQAEPGN